MKSRANRKIQVVLTVPYFIIAAMAAAETDCVAALPGRMADLCIRLLPLKRVRAMFPLPPMNTVMVWHDRTDSDPGAKLFRDIVIEVARPRGTASSRKGPGVDL